MSHRNPQVRPRSSIPDANVMSAPHPPQTVVERYQCVRNASERLCEPLVVEDYVIQTMPDVSPTKWHLAHTTWFFETFVLKSDRQYKPLDPQYEYLFNSYYNAVGEQYCRPKRGILSRPTVDDVYRYRAHVDEHMVRLLEQLSDDRLAAVAPVIELGINHEQQHQELMLTDVKHVFAANVLRAVYGGRVDDAPQAQPQKWIDHDEGVYSIGHEGKTFAYDNESPRHRVFLERFQIASRLITCSEYRAFMADGGYQRPELWLSDGWNIVKSEQWSAPLYWEREDDRWLIFTLSGRREIAAHEPVCHVSFYEADAYARWAGARLVTEAEWEVAAASAVKDGNFVESQRFHPASVQHDERDAPAQMFGDVWEWTASAYNAYPGYTAAEGALGEYNSKFMCNQMILRGGSCATPASHIRSTYRNFFPPQSRWQFAGIRLARSV